TTFEVVGDLPLDGFNRINPAGDDQHVLVSTSTGFQVLASAQVVLGVAHVPSVHVPLGVVVFGLSVAALVRMPAARSVRRTAGARG
ncbi:hypothetical protein ACFU6K_36690, partial [Kitasatospora sp. NPDC057512]